MFLTLFREQIKIRSNIYVAYVLQQQNTVKKTKQNKQITWRENQYMWPRSNKLLKRKQMDFRWNSGIFDSTTVKPEGLAKPLERGTKMNPNQVTTDFISKHKRNLPQTSALS